MTDQEWTDAERIFQLELTEQERQRLSDWLYTDKPLKKLDKDFLITLMEKYEGYGKERRCNRRST